MDGQKRNVVDFYRYWTTDAIKADMREKSHNFSVLISNQFNDFNMGTVIRNANAFCAREVIIYGRRQYDRRGTVGAHHYVNLKHVRFTDEIELSGSIVIGVDNLEGAVPLETFEWPKEHVVLVFGQEGTGLTEDLLKLCSNLVYIQQYGTVRSLNVGCASAIAMYDYCRKMVSSPT